jgi:hypothetical protein
MEWKIYESPPGPPLMGFKGVSYMGYEITRNGKILDKEDDIKDGDKFSIVGDEDWVVENNKRWGRNGETYCALEFAKDDRKCWVAAGFWYCPYIPNE